MFSIPVPALSISIPLFCFEIKSGCRWSPLSDFARGFAPGWRRAGTGRVEHHASAGGRQGGRRRAEAGKRKLWGYRQAHQARSKDAPGECIALGSTGDPFCLWVEFQVAHEKLMQACCTH